MYIWLLLKLFWGVFMNKKKKMCIQVLWLSFNVLKKKNPNVSNYEVVTSLSDVLWLIDFSIIRMT